MNLFVLLALIVCCFVIFYFCFRYWRRANFDKHLDLDVKIVFAQKTVVNKSREQGSVVFSLNHIPADFKGLCINKVKVHHQKCYTRSFHKLYFNLLKQSAFNELAVGVLASKSAIAEVDQHGIPVTVEGYLIKNTESKTYFAKKLNVNSICFL